MTTQSLTLNHDALDVLTELVNIGVGRAAASLSELIQQRIQLTVPKVRMERSATCESPFISVADETTATVVLQDFEGQFSGRSALVFPQNSSLLLAGMLSGIDEVISELDVELTGLLLEVGNILLNAVMGTFSNECRCPLEYSLPRLLNDHESLEHALSQGVIDDQDLMIADVQFHVMERAIRGSVVIIFTCGSALRLLERVELADVAVQSRHASELRCAANYQPE